MNDHERKPDRRIERTKRLLFESLMALITERGYETITLQDITDRANVARTTFYLHYKDKDELLFDGVRTMYEELLKGHAIRQTGSLSPAVEHQLMDDASDFEHVAKYADFYRIMLSHRGSAAFMTSVRDYLALLFSQEISAVLAPQGAAARVPVDALAYFMAGAEIGIVAWWLHQNEMKLTPGQMARMTYLMSMYGFNWALGVDAAPPNAHAASGGAEDRAEGGARSSSQHTV
jgi:AcrR family transcriptional regulator